jgi:hypothetical protein
MVSATRPTCSGCGRRDGARQRLRVEVYENGVKIGGIKLTSVGSPLGWRNAIPILTHTNGDAAVDQLLIAVARARYGAKDLRPVAIHAQLARPDQVERMVALGVVPSFFSAHTFFWGDWHRRNLGETRAAGISPLTTAQGP